MNSHVASKSTRISINSMQKQFANLDKQTSDPTADFNRIFCLFFAFTEKAKVVRCLIFGMIQDTLLLFLPAPCCVPSSSLETRRIEKSKKLFVEMMISLFISRFSGSVALSGEGKHVSNKCFWGETKAVKMKFWRKVWFHCSTLISRNSFLHDLLLRSSLFINEECSYRSIKMTVWVVFHLRDKRNEQKVSRGEDEQDDDSGLEVEKEIPWLKMKTWGRAEFATSSSSFLVYIIRFSSCLVDRSAAALKQTKPKLKLLFNVNSNSGDINQCCHV